MFAGRVRGNDGFAAALCQPVAQPFCVIGPVRQQAARCRDACQEVSDAGQVVRLARGQAERDGPADLVRQGMNLGRPSAARTSDRVDEIPPSAPLAERCALTCMLSALVAPITPEDPDRT